MISHKIAAASIALAASTFTAVPQSDDYCAPTPPPRGLVERCQSLGIVVPEVGWSEDMLRVRLTEWMATCVSKGRAASLVFDDDNNVSGVWEIIKDQPRSRTITIIPEYDANTFTRGGQRCYGVETVQFYVKGARGTVDIDGPIEYTPVPPGGIVRNPTDDDIKEAAKAAIAALDDSSVADNSGLPRFRGVLDGMARYGETFDDTWYNIAPTSSNGAACYNNGGRGCLPAGEALKTCTRRLRVELVSHYQGLKDKPEEFRVAMEGLNSQLFRSFQFFLQMHAAPSAAGFCPVLHQVLMPKVSEIASKGRTALYGYY